MKNTKEHILKTATRLFLKKNFKEVTMKEIVQASGMSKGAFYHYFSSKDQLFCEITDIFLSWAETDFSVFSDESLYDFYHQYLDYSRNVLPKLREWFSTDNQTINCNFYIMMFDALARYPGFRERLTRFQNMEMEAWRRIIGIARKKGEIRSLMSDDQIAKIFCFLPDGAGLQGFLHDRFESLETEIRELLDGFYAQLAVSS